MLADAESQALLARFAPPHSDDIFLRSHVGGVPTRVLGIPEVEIVVMRAHADEIFRARFLVELHQLGGIEAIGFPSGDHVLESHFRRMAEMFEMILVLAAVLDIDVARVPIAGFRGGLWSPVRPNAELGVAEPFGRGVALERLARAGKRSCGNRRNCGRLCAPASGSECGDSGKESEDCASRGFQ
jgi:hypothetical protein